MSLWRLVWSLMMQCLLTNFQLLFLTLVIFLTIYYYNSLTLVTLINFLLDINMKITCFLLLYLYEEKEAPLCLLTLNQHLKMLNHNY